MCTEVNWKSEKYIADRPMGKRQVSEKWSTKDIRKVLLTGLNFLGLQAGKGIFQ